MDVFTIIVSIVSTDFRGKPHVKPVIEGGIMINGMDFKTNSGLGIPDFIYFGKDWFKFLWSSAAVGQMHPQIYTIDRLKARCRQCFSRDGSGIGKEEKGGKQTEDGSVSRTNQKGYYRYVPEAAK